MKQSKKIITFFGLIFLIAGLIAAVFLAQKEQDIREKAAGPSGTTSISLNPQSADLQSGQAQTIEVKVNTNSILTDAVQFKLTIEGTATAQITAESVTGLNVLSQTVSGNTITYAAITTTQNRPFSTTIPTKIATITLTPTTAVNLVFDTTFSKIVQSGTSADILLTPTNGTYTLGGATASPSPLPSPSSAPDIGGGEDCDAPITPQNVKARTGSKSGEIVISWIAAPGATHYAINYGTSSRNYIYGAANVGNVREYIVKGLNPGTTYYLAATAVNDCGSSPHSNETSATAFKTSSASTGSTTKPTPTPSTTAFVPSLPSAAPTLDLPSFPPSPTPEPSPETFVSPPKPQGPNKIIFVLGGLIGAIIAFLLFRRLHQKAGQGPNIVQDLKPSPPTPSPSSPPEASSPSSTLPPSEVPPTPSPPIP